MAVTVEYNPNIDIEKAPKHYIVQGGTAKPTSVPIGSFCWDATVMVVYKTYDGTNWVVYNPNFFLATKTSATPLTTGTLFTFTGTIGILSLTGRVSTTLTAGATTMKYSYRSDALTARDLCATLDINTFTAGTLLSITGTSTDALVGADAYGGIVPGQSGMVTLTCVTSGIITVTYGAATAGAIVHEMLWIPLNAVASVT